MFLRALAILAITSCCVEAASIDHDKVQPFPQPELVTVSEKAGVKFKPNSLLNAAGEISGGLKGTKGTDGCDRPALGSQVYGRCTWHKDVWAIMYAWYYPKGFHGPRASRRHDWANAVVWIDNPALETPKILGLSMSTTDYEYTKYAPAPDNCVANSTTATLKRDLRFDNSPGPAYLACGKTFDDIQNLIMWDQLTDQACIALNTADFGVAQVPMNENNFIEKLNNAWPF